MSKALTMFSGFGSPAAMEAVANTLDVLASSVSMDGLPILKLDRKTGEWFFGQEDIAVDDNDLWAVNPTSFREGWIAFDEKANAIAETEDGELAEVLAPIGQAPSYNELPYLEAPKRGPMPQWKRQIAVELTCIDGPNKGEVVVYKPTSQGGLSAISKLSGEIARRIRSGGGDYVPAIVLRDTSYDHKTWGKTYKPVLEIEEWYAPNDSEVRREENEEDDEPKSRGRGRSKDRDKEDDKPKSRGRGRSKDRDEEDDEPKSRGRGRSKDRDEEDDEPKSRGRGRSKDRDEEDDEPKSRGRGRSKDRDEEDDEPKSRGRGRSKDRDEEDDEPKSRGRGRSKDRDEEDDEPKSRGRGRSKDRDEEDDEPKSRGRGRSKDRDEEDDEPKSRGRGRSKDRDEEDDEPKSRGRGRSKDRDEEDDEPRGERRRGRGRR